MFPVWNADGQHLSHNRVELLRLVHVMARVEMAEVKPSHDEEC